MGNSWESCLNLLLHLLGCLHICCWNRWCLQQVHLTHQESPGGSNAGAKTRWVSSSGVREPHLDVESFSKLRKAINSTWTQELAGDFFIGLASATVNSPRLYPSCLASCRPWALSSSRVVLAWRPSGSNEKFLSPPCQCKVSFQMKEPSSKGLWSIYTFLCQTSSPCLQLGWLLKSMGSCSQTNACF